VLRRSARGFTLLEVIITVVIVAIASAVILPAVSNQTRADLRKSANIVCGAIRQAYDEATLTGQTYRLRFDVKKSIIHVDATEKVLNFDNGTQGFVEQSEAAAGSGDLVDPMAMPMPPLDEDEKESPKSDNPAASFLKLNDAGKGGSENIFQPAGADIALESSVQILDLWTEGMSSPASEGELYLLFFPQGETQEAIINLQDQDKRVFAIKIAPLTGKATIVDHYVEAKK
jgi:general secretion pathway protein H